MKRFPILFYLLVGVFQLSFSQSEFLLRDQSGFRGEIGCSTNREENGVNLAAGYSYHGFIDANLTYAKANGGSTQGGILTPSITFYPLKQEDAEIAPTLGVSLSFSRYTSKTTETVIVPDSVIVTWRSYDRVTELTVNALTLGVTAERTTGSWNTFFFQPVVGAGLVMKNNGWDFTLRGGVSIGTHIDQCPLLIFTPSIERQSGLTTLMLTFGAVF
jgi:hypothetical protein